MLITTEQARKYLKLNATLSEESFSPFIPDAEQKYIKPFLGDDLFEILDAWAVEKEAGENELAALYPYVVAALARFTLFIASPHLDINVGESGFTVQGNTTLVPASTDRVRRFTGSTEQLAWDNIESLLRFLEENKVDYPEWVDSEAYTMANKNLINSAVEFNRFVNIDNSRLTFHRLRIHIDNVEKMDVIPLISKAQYDDLKSKGSYSDQEKQLLEHLKGFIANKVAHLHLERLNKDVYSFYFNQARDYINVNADHFPQYKASTSNDQAEPPFSDFENNKDKSIFMA